MTALDGIGDINVEDLLNQLELDNVLPIGRGEVQFSCPYSAGHTFGDAHPSAHMNQDKLVYRCKGCGRSGTAMELVAAVKKISPIEAIRWLRVHYGSEFKPLEGSAAAEARKLEEKWSTKQVQELVQPIESETIGERGIFSIDWRSDHDAATYMRSRGFSPELLEDWGMGFDTWTSRITIPIRDVEGALVGFKGRALDPNASARYSLMGDTEDRKPRYNVGYGFDMYDPTGVVFGLDRAIRSPRQGPRRRVVLAEGELNAIALHDAGVSEAAATGTTTLTIGQQRLLRWYAEEIVLFYDSDLAGTGAAWGTYDDKQDVWRPGVIEKLAKYVRVLVVPDHEGDAASMPREEAADLVARASSWIGLAVE